MCVCVCVYVCVSWKANRLKCLYYYVIPALDNFLPMAQKTATPTEEVCLSGLVVLMTYLMGNPSI